MGRGGNNHRNMLYQPVADSPLNSKSLHLLDKDNDWQETILISRERNWPPGRERPFADTVNEYQLGFHRQRSLAEHNKLVLSSSDNDSDILSSNTHKLQFKYHFFISQGFNQPVKINLKKYYYYLCNTDEQYWKNSIFSQQTFIKSQLDKGLYLDSKVVGFIQDNNDLQTPNYNTAFRSAIKDPENYFPLLRMCDLKNDQTIYQGFDSSWDVIVSFNGSEVEVPVSVTDLPTLPANNLLLSKICLTEKATNKKLPA
jgi:hypothetical protein